jgi:hypothetical protein
MHRIPAFVAFAALLGSVLAAQEPSVDEQRAEAHRTIMRRFSATEKAKTATLGLSKDATEFVDLYLDMHRNKADVRRRKAPRSSMFTGVVHPVMKIEEGKLDFAVCFVQLTIDRVQVPLVELPSILAAALESKFTEAVGVLTDSKRNLTGFTLQLVAELASVGDGHLDDATRKGSHWTELKSRATRHVIRNLDELTRRELYSVLSCLRRIGDDTTAEALIEKLATIPARIGAEQKRRVYARAIAGMRGEKAVTFFKKVMAGEDLGLRVAVLQGLQRASSDEVYGILGAILAPDARPAPPVKRAAVSALARIKGKRAVGILEKVFPAVKDAMEKYHLACELTRMDSPVAVPYLEKKVKEYEADPARRGRAGYVKRLLEEYRKRNSGGKKRDEG